MALTEVPLPPTTSLWRNRDFQLLWSGQVISVLGTRISSVAIPLVALDLTHSPAATGIVAFAATLPLLLFSLPAGAILDRTSRKPVMLACEAVRALAFGGIAAGLWLKALTFPELVLAALISGIGFTVFDVAQRAIIRQVVHRDHLPAAFAQTQAREFLGLVLGPPIGGFLYTVGQIVPFIVNAASFMVSIGSVASMRTRFQETRDKTTPRNSIARDVAEGVRWLLHDSFLYVTTVILGASTVLINALFLALVVLLRQAGASGTEVGLMVGLLGAGGLAGTLIATPVTKRVAPGAVVIAGLALPAILCPLFLVVHGGLADGLVLFVMFLAQPPINTVIGPLRVRLVPDGLQARVSSVISLVNLGGVPLGQLFIGYALQWWGGAASIWIVTASMAAIALAAVAAPQMRSPPALTAVG